jgi:hypothetical protein
MEPERISPPDCCGFHLQAEESSAVEGSMRPGNGDHPSRFYADECARLIANGVPARWTPVIETHK